MTTVDVACCTAAQATVDSLDGSPARFSWQLRKPTARAEHSSYEFLLLLLFHGTLSLPSYITSSSHLDETF